MKMTFTIVIGTTAILAGGVVLFLVMQDGVGLSVLSDEYEAPVHLNTMLQSHGADSEIPLKPVTVQHLSTLIQRLNYELFIQKCLTVILAVLCILSGTMLLLRKKDIEAAQQNVGEVPPELRPDEPST